MFISPAPPTDRRSVLVELNPKARAIIAAMFTYTGQATAHAAHPLSSTELAAVKQFLHDLAQAYDLTDPLAGLQDARTTGGGHIDRHTAAQSAARTRPATSP